VRMDGVYGAQDAARGASAVDLYWLGLGAGNRSVQWDGRVIEAVNSVAHRRPRFDLYHSALELNLAVGRFLIEQAPVPDAHGATRSVVAEGAVGTRWAGRFQILAIDRSSVTKCGAGGTDASRTSVNGSTARAGSAAMSYTRDGSSRWPPACRRRCGAAMNARRARCGTRTR